VDNVQPTGFDPSPAQICAPGGCPFITNKDQLFVCLHTTFFICLKSPPCASHQVAPQDNLTLCVPCSRSGHHRWCQSQAINSLLNTFTCYSKDYILRSYNLTLSVPCSTPGTPLYWVLKFRHRKSNAPIDVHYSPQLKLTIWSYQYGNHMVSNRVNPFSVMCSVRGWECFLMGVCLMYGLH
jgi:hypothetical protein